MSSPVRWQAQADACRRIGLTARELKRAAEIDYHRAYRVVRGELPISADELAAVFKARPVSARMILDTMSADDVRRRQLALCFAPEPNHGSRSQPA